MRKARLEGSMFEKTVDYGLHDTLVHDIEVEENGVSLSFREGVYELSGEGKEISLTKPCKMCITVENFDKTDLYAHCSFYKCRKNRYAEIGYSELKTLLGTNPFEIDLDYYSPFARAVLLRGHIGAYRIEMQITEVQTIAFEAL